MSQRANTVCDLGQAQARYRNRARRNMRAMRAPIIHLLDYLLAHACPFID
jgi:hypothetical protein